VSQKENSGRSHGAKKMSRSGTGPLGGGVEGGELLAKEEGRSEREHRRFKNGKGLFSHIGLEGGEGVEGKFAKKKMEGSGGGVVNNPGLASGSSTVWGGKEWSHVKKKQQKKTGQNWKTTDRIKKRRMGKSRKN